MEDEPPNCKPPRNGKPELPTYDNARGMRTKNANPNKAATNNVVLLTVSNDPRPDVLPEKIEPSGILRKGIVNCRPT
jgi:hypothetical protein